jgi:hypothetical protein
MDSLWIKAPSDLLPKSLPSGFARLPFAPRHALYFEIARGCGSSFQARYVSGGSLFLEPLGTTPIMPQAALGVKGKSQADGHFSSTNNSNLFN